MADMRAKYEALSVSVLKDLAKTRGLKNVSAMKKAEVIEAMLAEDARQEKQEETTQKPSQKEPENKPESKQDSKPENKQEEKTAPAKNNNNRTEQKNKPENNRVNFNEPPTPDEQKELIGSELDSGEEVCGILEIMPDGYGFIRSDNYLPGDHDVYV